MEASSRAPPAFAFLLYFKKLGPFYIQKKASDILVFSLESWGLDLVIKTYAYMDLRRIPDNASVTRGVARTGKPLFQRLLLGGEYT
jgi:hypothetical protein